MAAPRILSEAALAAAVTGLPEWKIADGKLTASFEFNDFAQAFAFMTSVAAEAELLEHHPEWTNVYNKVDVRLSTHDAGDAITDLDVALASFMSTTAKQGV